MSVIGESDNRSISSLDLSAIQTLENISICDAASGERVADKSAVESLSNGELLNVYRAGKIALNSDDPNNIFVQEGLLNTSLFELVNLTLEGRLLDAIEHDKNALLTKDQEKLLDFSLEKSTDWAKFTRASRIINDGLSYLAKETFIEDARLAKSTKTTKYLKGANKKNMSISLDGEELEVTNKSKKRILRSVKEGAKGKNGITVAAIGDAKILKEQSYPGKSLLVLERTDDINKSLLIATDKVDFPKNKAEVESFSKKIANDLLPTADLPLHSESKYPYMNRLVGMYNKYKKNPLISKVIRKIPVAGTVAGVMDATKQYIAGDWFSGSMTLLGEVAKGALAIPVGFYNLTEIGLHLAGYEITKVFKDGAELLEAKYNQLTVDANTLGCEQKVVIEPIKCEKEWSDIQGTYIDACEGDFENTFTARGDLYNKANEYGDQRIDKYLLEDKSEKQDGKILKGYNIGLTFSTPGSHRTSMSIGYDGPNGNRYYAMFYDYDDSFITSKLSARNKRREHYGLPPMSFEEEKKDLIGEINHANTYPEYINGNFNEQLTNWGTPEPLIEFRDGVPQELEVVAYTAQVINPDWTTFDNVTKVTDFKPEYQMTLTPVWE